MLITKGVQLIVSASMRTDIPAFYGAWFANRLRAGYCMVSNPYSGVPYRVSLSREDADGFVFCTRNVSPFMRRLEEVDSLAFPFIVDCTITGYPRELESSVIDPAQSARRLHEISDRYGPRAAVWRYDTILFTSLTSRAFHVENFERIARSLSGATDEAVVSFAQFYLKTRRNLDIAAREYGFTWWDPSHDEKLSLLAQLRGIVLDNGMELTVCGQRDLAVDGVRESVCIDARRLSDVAGYPIEARLKSHRKVCSCHESRDIGEYDTCTHGCVYCYATKDLETAKARHRAHDPLSEFLVPRGRPAAPDVRSCRDLAGGGAT
jgi:Domain of unknown function (DUF1848)